MQNMSFAQTTDQIRRRTKTVTRRLGWLNLEPGTLIQAVVKSQGLKKGEAVQKIAVLRVVSVHRESMAAFLKRPDAVAECFREGFPEMTPQQFHDFFVGIHARRRDGDIHVTRIEFTYE